MLRLTLVALLAAALLPVSGLAAPEAPDLAGAYATVKQQLSAGAPGDARATYDAAFAPHMGGLDAIDARIVLAFGDAARHHAEGATAPYNLDRQVIDKSLLQGAFVGSVHELREGDVAGAAPWFAVLKAKFPNAQGGIAAFEALQAAPADAALHLPAYEKAFTAVFTGKVREEVQEVLGNWAKPATAEEKAVEGIVYYQSIVPYVAAVLGTAGAAELQEELETLRAAVQRGDRAAADHAAEEALGLLAAFEAGGAAQGREVALFVSALDGLVHEYNEYVRDGAVVNQANYEAEVLGLFLPQVERTWIPVRDLVAARDAEEAGHIGGDVTALAAAVRGLAANAAVEALALDLRTDVQRVLGDAAPPVVAGTPLEALRATEAKVDEAVAAYAAGDAPRALALLQSAYLDVYAPGAEASVPRDLNARIERLLNVELRGAVQRSAPLAEVQATQATLHGAFEAAAASMAAPKTDAGLFANSLVIIAREGFEAALVLAAVVGYLVRSGHKDKTRQIYLGAGIGVAASLLLFSLVSTVFTLSGANREILEGATALLAVVVLFYVSYWLIDKVQIKRWNRFIQGQVRSALTGGRTYALVSIAFLAVFREGLETVLFYQALLGSAATASAGFSVLGGFVVGFVALAAVFLAFTRYGVNIPMRPFFLLTSAMLYYLAFAFMGAGVHELQEAAVLPSTPLPGLQAVLDGSPLAAGAAAFLGVFATVETLAAQAVLLLAAVGGLVYSFVIVPRREPDVVPVGSVEV